jgi:CysZ protein
MRPLGIAVGSIRAAFRDIFSARLGGLALLCISVALAGTIGAAWAAFRFLGPLIPEGTGAVGVAYTIAHWLAGAGIVVVAIVLAPAVSMVAGGGLFDVAAARVEKAIGAPEGRGVPALKGSFNGLRIALPALFFNVIVIPLYFIPVVGVIVFFWLNGYLMGREYGTLAATRRMTWREARRLRRSAPLSFFLVGLVCSVIPFVAPLLGASAMTRLVTRLSSESNSV